MILDWIFTNKPFFLTDVIIWTKSTRRTNSLNELLALTIHNFLLTTCRSIRDHCPSCMITYYRPRSPLFATIATATTFDLVHNRYLQLIVNVARDRPSPLSTNLSHRHCQSSIAIDQPTVVDQTFAVHAAYRGCLVEYDLSAYRVCTIDRDCIMIAFGPTTENSPCLMPLVRYLPLLNGLSITVANWWMEHGPLCLTDHGPHGSSTRHAVVRLAVDIHNSKQTKTNKTKH